MVVLGSGVYEVVGRWTAPWGETYQRTLSVPCNVMYPLSAKARERLSLMVVLSWSRAERPASKVSP